MPEYSLPLIAVASSGLPTSTSVHKWKVERRPDLAGGVFLHAKGRLYAVWWDCRTSALVVNDAREEMGLDAQISEHMERDSNDCSCVQSTWLIF